MNQLNASMFILYVFLFLMFSFLLFVIVVCCKFAIFEDDSKSENRKRAEKEDTAPTETSHILSRISHK